MHVDHDHAAAAVLESLDVVETTLRDLRGDDVLAASRCRGWTAGDVLVHVHLGLQEMLLGLVTRSTAAADTDAVSYWAGDPAGTGAALGQVRFVRLLASAYRDPSGLVTHALPTVAGVRHAVAGLRPGRVAFQGHVLETGDFLATWAVELAVHQLDIAVGLDVAPPAPTSLRLARLTGEELSSARPVDEADETAVLALWRG